MNVSTIKIDIATIKQQLSLGKVSLNMFSLETIVHTEISLQSTIVRILIIVS